jgi:uncharacterized surface protein with fasciclin (FAS1) repeats
MKKFVLYLTVFAISGSVFADRYVVKRHKTCAGNSTVKSCQTVISQGHAIPTVAHRPAAASDIVDTAVSAGSFKTLVAAVKAAGLVETLKGKGPFTVFAPTDEAFAKLPEGTVANLLKPENKDQLISVLTYHVVPGKVMAADVVKLKSAKTVQGQEVAIKVEDGKVMVDGAQVVKTDIGCSNGVIHVIDSVILPKASAPAADIVDTAVKAGTFKTLVAAVQAAGLVDTLKSAGPFTVFAPSDEAFAKLPEGTVANLLKPENKDQLVAVLTYHVVPGKLLAADVIAAKELKTVNGKSAKISTEKGAKIDGANIVATDIECANGVVHVIDSVILP